MRNNYGPEENFDASETEAANESQLDVLTFGECMIRLSPPGHQRIEFAPVFRGLGGCGEETSATHSVVWACVPRGLAPGGKSLGAFFGNPPVLRNGYQPCHMIPYDGSAKADRHRSELYGSRYWRARQPDHV